MDDETRQALDELRRRERAHDPFDDLPGIAAEAAENWPPDAREALQRCLSIAWSGLQDARRNALNGSWSIECANKVETIMGLTRIVGPTDWGEVPADLLLDGWYERIHAAIGVEAPFTEADRARAQAVMDRRTQRLAR